MYSDALLTDLYQLTMAAGYLDSGRADDKVDVTRQCGRDRRR